MTQLLFESLGTTDTGPLRGQLLKWIGNKQRFAPEIISYFPKDYARYIEPFLGSGGVLATLAPAHGIGSDVFPPLIEIWSALKERPDELERWYSERWHLFASGDRRTQYEAIKASYNARPNGADLLFLCRACYGGVVRFRKDGYMSTPIGIHAPITPESFARRVDAWGKRVAGTQFLLGDYRSIMDAAERGDLVYCDPPYNHSQTILYGAQNFRLAQLFETIGRCKSRGVRIALSIDGQKKSGTHLCALPIPDGLFERVVFINCGRSMLKRFQMNGKDLRDEVVADRLLLTY